MDAWRTTVNESSGEHVFSNYLILLVKTIKRMPATFLAIFLFPAIFSAAVALHGDDVVRDLRSFVAALHKYHVDDAIVCLSPLALGIFLDHRNRRRNAQREIEAQKLRTFRATMRTVHDIVNNFLNNLLLVQFELEQYAPAERLRWLDEVIQDTSRKLKALGEVQSLCEIETPSGPTVAYKHDHAASRDVRRRVRAAS